MARGIKSDERLVYINTKVEKSTKELIDALVKVKKMGSQRELLNEMLEVYCKKNKDDYEKAMGLIKFLK